MLDVFIYPEGMDESEFEGIDDDYIDPNDILLKYANNVQQAFYNVRSNSVPYNTAILMDKTTDIHGKWFNIPMSAKNK